MVSFAIAPNDHVGAPPLVRCSTGLADDVPEAGGGLPGEAGCSAMRRSTNPGMSPDRSRSSGNSEPDVRAPVSFAIAPNDHVGARPLVRCSTGLADDVPESGGGLPGEA